MKYSDTTNLSGIIQEIERLCDFSNTYISGDVTRLREFTARVNQASKRVWHLIFMSSGNWQYDDAGQDEMPVATTSLVDGQGKYTLPTEALTIKRIECQDENDNWFNIKPITPNQIPGAISEFNDVDNLPVWYTLISNVVELYPAPNYNKTNGLKIFFDRADSEFVNTDTTKEPGFASPYHRLLPIKVAIDWYKVKQPQSPTLGILIQDDMKLEQGLKEYYAKRFVDYRPRITRQYARYK